MFKSRESNLSTSLTSASLILAALVFPAAARADETGRCYKADVPATLVLPNGTEHGPGQLKICLTMKVSPVEGRHDTYVDRELIGGFRSRLGKAEGSDGSDDAFFVFSCASGGRLSLEGYVVANGDTLRTYHMTEDSGSGDTAWLSPDSGGSSTNRKPFIRIAEGSEGSPSDASIPVPVLPSFCASGGEPTRLTQKVGSHLGRGK